MTKKQSNLPSEEKNADLKQIMIEIKAFDQVQTVDRLRQWLENPERLPKTESGPSAKLIPKHKKK